MHTCLAAVRNDPELRRKLGPKLLQLREELNQMDIPEFPEFATEDGPEVANEDGGVFERAMNGSSDVPDGGSQAADGTNQVPDGS
eukprot:3443933-Pleurochrysis_carterae.AAC.1